MGQVSPALGGPLLGEAKLGSPRGWRPQRCPLPRNGRTCPHTPRNGRAASWLSSMSSRSLLTGHGHVAAPVPVPRAQEQVLGGKATP